MLHLRMCLQIWCSALWFLNFLFGYTIIVQYLGYNIIKHFNLSAGLWVPCGLKGVNLVKKAISIVLIFLILTSALAGCGRDEPAETTAVTTIIKTTMEETKTPAQVLTDEQILALSASDFEDYLLNMDTKDLKDFEIEDLKTALMAKQFLTYMKDNRFEDVIAFIMHDASASEFDPSAYSFFNDVVVESFTMSPTSSGSDFKVTLNISKSSSKILPVGTSRWFLGVVYDGFVFNFRRANDSSSIFNWTTNGDLPDFCYDVTYFLTRFETMNNFNKLAQDAQKDGNFDSFCNCLIYILLSNGWDEDATLKSSEAEALAKITFGITNVDFRKCAMYNNADDTLRVDPAGYGYIPSTLVSVTNNGRLRTVVIDYYSDPAYFLKAKTMEYVVRVNDDDSLSMLSTRLVYDSGFSVYEFIL